MVTATTTAPPIVRPISDDGHVNRVAGALAQRVLWLLYIFRPPDGWIAAGLLALNMVIVVWSVEVADWAPTPALVATILLAVFTALILTRVRLWAAVLIPGGLLIGAGVIIWQLTASAPEELRIASNAELFNRLWDWVLAARHEGISVDPLPFAVGLMISAWLSGFLAGWVFFRYRNFWGVFALGSLGLLSNLTFLPENASVYLGIYIFTGLLLVGWVQSVRTRQRWDLDRHVYDGHLGILTASDTVLVALVALLIAFLIPVGGQWGPANSVYNFTRSPLIHWEEDFNRLFAGLPARRPLPYRIWGDTMAFQGTINPTNTPVLQVNSGVPLYWKARSYPTYTHEGWLSEGTVLKEPGWQPDYSAPSPEQERFNVTFEVIPKYDSRSLFAGGQTVGANRDIRIETFDSPRYVINPRLGEGIDELPTALRQAVDGVRSTVALDPYASDEAVASAIPNPFQLESVEREDDGTLATATIGEIVPSQPDVLAVRASGGNANSGDPYQLTASVSSADPEDLRLVDEEYPTWAWIRYTQLPAEMPPRVEALARDITAGADNPYDKAKAVETWLKTNISYNLAIDPPPFGSDGVDHFLFESKEGYSEYFGSAMTVLMRSLGIPARMTTGYTTGNLVDGSNLYLVSDRHSHGWSEVYFPGYGWIPFEPTPGKEIPLVVPPEEQAAMAALRAASEGSAELPCEIEEDCEEADISLDADQFPAPETPTTALLNAARAAMPWAIGVGGVLLLISFSGWLAWRLLLKTPRDAAVTYLRLRRLGRFATLGPAQHQTPHQWATRVADALPEHRFEVFRIVDAYTLRTYSGRAFDEPPDGNSVADAWHAIRFPLLWYGLRRKDA